MNDPAYERITNITAREDEGYWKQHATDLGGGCYVEVLEGRQSALFAHRKEDGSMCWARLPLAVPPIGWRVLQWDPLTLEPSILCTQHSFHGFIREGNWVPA